MKLSVNLTLIIFLMIFTISSVVQSREPSRRNKKEAFITSSGRSASNPNNEFEGITGIREGKDGKIELDFDFNCNVLSCKQTLHDTNGLASIVAVVSELEREYACKKSGVNIKDMNWNLVIKPFLKERAKLLRDFCHEEVSKHPPFAAVTSLHAKPMNIMKHCGDIVGNIQKFLDNPDTSNFCGEKKTENPPPPPPTRLHCLLPLSPLRNMLYNSPYHPYPVFYRPHPEGFNAQIGYISSGDSRIAMHHTNLRLLIDRRGSSLDSRRISRLDSRRISREGSELCRGVKSGRLAELLRGRKPAIPSKPIPIEQNSQPSKVHRGVR